MYPFTICWKQSWYCKHSVYDGKRLVFDGNGAQLIGKWICWILLTIVTLFVFAFFIPMRIERWKASHTHLADDTKYLAQLQKQEKTTNFNAKSSKTASVTIPKAKTILVLTIISSSLAFLSLVIYCCLLNLVGSGIVSTTVFIELASLVLGIIALVKFIKYKKATGHYDKTSLILLCVTLGLMLIYIALNFLYFMR